VAEREFSLRELEALAYRAGVAGMRFAHASPSLARAYGRLAEAADALHAVELRERGPEASSEASDDDPPEDLELGSGEPSEDKDGVPVPAHFKIRPKGVKRTCGAPGCGLPQWKSPGGWTCDNGHGGAPSLKED
jgi:hypothetical protein